jgi:hypothetical protein
VETIVAGDGRRPRMRCTEPPLERARLRSRPAVATPPRLAQRAHFFFGRALPCAERVSKVRRVRSTAFDAVLTATCLVAAVMTIAMGLYTNRAYALASGLGINAIVAFQLVATEGLSFPAAMGLIVIEGIAVTVLVVSGLREQIMRAIPLEPKKAIAIGIGLFIAFIGLYDAGIVVRGTGTPLELGRFATWPIFVALLGIVITVALHTDSGATCSSESSRRRSWRRSSTSQRPTPASQAARAGRIMSRSTRTSRCSATSTSMPSRSSVSCRRSSGRSRSSSPTSSTRWERSSAWGSKPAT